MLRYILIGVYLASAGGALAAMQEVGGGYGAIDAPRDVTPLELGALFCDGRKIGNMSAIAGFLAPKLDRLVSHRPEADVPWQSFDTRPESCSLEVLNGYDDTIGVLVQITYEGATRSWSDVLNLERTPDSWWINNIFYEIGGNLRFRLVQSD